MNSQRPIVLVGVDGSADSERAVAWATDYVHSTGGTLRLATAWDWPTFQDAPIALGDYDPARSARTQLRAVARRCGLPSDRVDLVVSKGAPARVLLEQAKEADLLVLGTRGLGGFARLVLGSVSAACVHHAPCPVAIVRGIDDRKAPAGIVVGIDASMQSLSALRWVMDYSEASGVPLTVVTVIQEPPTVPSRLPTATDAPTAAVVATSVRLWLEETVEKEQVLRPQRLTPEPRLLVLEGNPPSVMVDASAEATLVVVGDRGTGGFRRMLVGSVTTALAHHAESSVVVVHEPPDEE
jgi:nucleotide-binding universal stress UspA family protein